MKEHQNDIMLELSLNKKSTINIVNKLFQNYYGAYSNFYKEIQINNVLCKYETHRLVISYFSEEEHELCRKHLHIFSLAHELMHQKQYETKKLITYKWLDHVVYYYDGLLFFEKYISVSYDNRPWEVEANKFALEYIKKNFT